MANEQEGIDIETLNPENEGIYIPDEEIDTTVDTENETPEVAGNNVGDNETETTVDTDKENLKKGVNYERKLRKEAEKKNKELEARIKALEESNKTPEKTTLEELVESGIDEGIAKSIATAIDKKQEGSKQTEKELANLKFQLSLSETSKIPGFEDIADYADEIKTLVDKGLTIEQGYYALTGGRKTNNSNSEIERKLEAKLENKQARKEILGNINKNVGATVVQNKSKLQATAEEVAIAKAAGMSIEDYLAVKGIDNVKEYAEYSKGKK
jgi:hypothetical protein